MLRYLITAAILMASLSSGTAGAWTLVADRVQSVPLSDVVCLLSSDASGRMTVVCEKNASLYNVSRVTFSPEGQDAAVDATFIPDEEISFVAGGQIMVTGLSKSATLRVYSADGRCCLSRELNAYEETQTVDISGLTPGPYIAEIRGVTIKLLKK